MSTLIRRWRLILAAALLLSAMAAAQWTQLDGTPFIPISQDRKGVATWTNESMPEDVFTFVRIRYTSNRVPLRWTTDYPDSDLNLSLRLQELTSLRVNPEPIFLQFMDPKLKNYPFAYVVEPGFLDLRPEEIAGMREYCLSGGFLMFDDHWGDVQYRNTEKYLRMAFPEYPIVELTVDHPIFHSVFDFKEMPQVFTPGGAVTGREKQYGPVDYHAIFDENQRMMLIVCHNTDTGDAWEREGVDEWYFQEYGVKKAYPLAINILFYAMTH